MPFHRLIKALRDVCHVFFATLRLYIVYQDPEPDASLLPFLSGNDCASVEMDYPVRYSPDLVQIVRNRQEGHAFFEAQQAGVRVKSKE